MATERMLDEGKAKPRKAEESEQVKQRPPGQEMSGPGLASLQQLVGNRAVQRLLAQRSGDGAFELDDETAGRINRERGGGQPLDTALQKQASGAMGHDLSGVRVHTSPEADDLSGQLSANAFTTGQDIFFREGAYDPHSSGGRELIAHELTHVVQQDTGAVGGAGRMTVNPPGDAYEQEADAIAQSITGTAAETTGVPVQRQEIPEDELAQTKSIQRRREDLQMNAVQREVPPRPMPPMPGRVGPPPPTGVPPLPTEEEEQLPPVVCVCPECGTTFLPG